MHAEMKVVQSCHLMFQIILSCFEGMQECFVSEGIKGQVDQDHQGGSA